MKDRIYVVVRARPLSPEDSKTSPWRISGNSISLANQLTKFEFDRIFQEDCKTVDLFEARTKEIVVSAVQGFNGTIFAYGQTNSGKTHTMRGSAAEPGIIPLAVHDLFQSIQEDVDREFLVRMSYMEIYNEDINDLLAPDHRKLQIHESLERGIYVAGLREEIVTSPEQVLDLLEFGESHRQIGQTNMNLYSSRSHTVFRMIVESREKIEDGDQDDCCDVVRVSVLNLIDLAGSERAAKTGAEGTRLKEGSHINKSLMTLGTVIKKLSEGAESQGGHVPYRDSKLTRILQPALGGNANTAIICNITLAQIHTDETKSSLQFASRALRVANCACVNEILTDAALLKRQRKEIEELRAKLLSSHSEHLEGEILNLRNTLLQSELEKERITLELEEEKKAKAHRERRLFEQAKKIANLSALLLCSEKDEKIACTNKNNRRVTWCPRPSSRKCHNELSTLSQTTSIRDERDTDMPVPFEELIQDTEVACDYLQGDRLPENIDNKDTMDELLLPDAHALLRVTDRKKMHLKRLRDNEAMEKHSEYEDHISEYDVQEEKEAESASLSYMLGVVECFPCEASTSDSICQLGGSIPCDRKTLSLRESEAILVIKRLEDQIRALEAEKSSIQRNLDNVIGLVTEQNVSLREKYKEEDYQKTEVRTFEMEAEIASLKEALIGVVGEKEETLARNGILESELEAMTNKLNTAESEINILKEENNKMAKRLHESESFSTDLETSIDLLSKEKEEQLTNVLLKVNEEKSTWLTEEKVQTESNERVKTSSDEIISLSKDLLEAMHELERYREQYMLLRESLALSEESIEREKECSGSMSSKNDQHEQYMIDNVECKDVMPKLEVLSFEHHHAYEEMQNLLAQSNNVIQERDKLFVQVNGQDTGSDLSNNHENLKSQLVSVTRHRDVLLSKLEDLKKIMLKAETHKKEHDDMLVHVRSGMEELARRLQNESLVNNKEKTKLISQLRSTQTKLDAFRGRYEEVVDEMKLMNKRFEAASSKLKEQLRWYGEQLLRTQKRLVNRE